LQENEKQFRFEDFEIWKKGASISGPLFELADELDNKRFYHFAEQLRAATLSITNNIAEGSGSVSDPEFAHYLNMSRRSVFEVANILMMLSKDNYLPREKIQALLSQLEEESRMLLAFIRTLKS
jgi:four helix bundle protein